MFRPHPFLCVVLIASAQTIRHEGQARLFEHCSADLDAGDFQCMLTLDGDGTEQPSHPPTKSDDFRLEPDGPHPYLQPRHEGRFAELTLDEAVPKNATHISLSYTTWDR